MKATTNDDVWQLASSVGVFLFFALMLSAPSGYSYGASLLLLSSVAFIAISAVATLKSRKLRKNGVLLDGSMKPGRLAPLSIEDKIIVYALLSVFLAAVLVFFVHGNSLSTLDQSSRCVLAIVMLFFLLKIPPRLAFMWAGLVAGTLSAAGVAAWQIYVLAIPRATGFVTSAVPFGNEALTMGMLCAAGMFWAGTQGAYARHWRLALFVGVLAGVYCSQASGTRGGWVALLPVFALFCTAFFTRSNMPKAGAALAVVAVAALALYHAQPNNSIEIRYQEAVSEIDNYLLRRDVATSIGGRLEAWRGAGLSVPERPLLGWGYVEYRHELERLVSRKELDPFVLTLVNTHNNYIEVLVFQGLIGLAALLALYAATFCLFCKRLRAPDKTVRVLALCGASLVVSFFVFGLTHVILGRNNGITFFLVTLVIVWASMRHQERVSQRQASSHIS
ncbi:hypothetical protein EKL30_10025 [Candidimonas sp. SYP-B2681]|uniref:O-antigen ligase family protein n=1 Tax=Candidimonas sp. SYP-B2681 TaxID=2497686 RepID=UPI000F895E78|nr:O-antigen ligase family protein [Candidimonas sp. SYP-B2681]RTZ43211.1 hypothetical protein EKL30_10025 [Candidimonas sp. SYP-B2681]